MCLLLSAGLRYKLLEAHQGGQSPGYGYLQRMGRGEHQRDQLSSAHWSAQETPSMGTHQGAQTSPGSGSLLIKPDSRENIQHVSVVSKNFRKLFCTFELKLCPFVALKAVPKRLKIQSNNDQDKMFSFSSIAVWHLTKQSEAPSADQSAGQGTVCTAISWRMTPPMINTVMLRQW